MTIKRNMDGSVRRMTSDVIVLPSPSLLTYMFLPVGDQRLGPFASMKTHKFNKNSIQPASLIQVCNRHMFPGSVAFLNALPGSIVIESITLKLNVQLGCRFYHQLLYVKATERVSGYRFTLRFTNNKPEERDSFWRDSI